MLARTILLRSAARGFGLVSLLVLSMATPPPVNAQDKERGTLQGRILDATTEELLPFANVVFWRVTRDNPDGVAAGGAMGTAEGTYEAKLAPGSYHIQFSYIGYRTLTVNSVFVSGGQATVVDGLLQPDQIQVEKVEVTAEAIRTAEGSMLAKLKNMATVNDAVTSSQISKSGDSNAAQALERVTGVSVVGGRYVFVRGLGERYSSTNVNGAALGTPETNKRVVPLDLFPSAVLDNIVVQKTYSPDLDADFAGGVVNVNTRDFIEGTTFQQSLSAGFTAGGEEGFLSYDGGRLDWLGFDDGTRELPGSVVDVGHRVDQTVPIDERRAMTYDFPNEWTPTRSSRNPNFSYSGVFNQGLRLLGKQAGVLASVSLANDYNSISKEENEFVGGDTLKAYDVEQSNAEVLGGITGNLSMKLSHDEDRNDRLKFNVLFTRNTTDIVKVGGGVNNDYGVEYAQQTDLAYLERSVSQYVMQGTHTTPLARTRLDWNLGYSQAKKDEPDRRRYVYERDAQGDLVVGGRTPHPFQRTYGHGNEYARSLKLDLTTPVHFLGEVPTQFKYGFATHNKDRDSEYRRFGFTCQRGGRCPSDRTPAPEELIISPDDTTGRPNYILEELTRENDTWVGDHSLSGVYLMADIPAASWLRAVVGARYEDSNQYILATGPYASTSDEILEVNNDDAAWYPSANLTWTPGPRTNVRLGYSRTINRPELRELSPFRYYNFEKGWEEEGNPLLHSAEIENWDTRVEYYAGPGEFLAFGVFNKDFEDPIQKVLLPLATGFKEAPENALEGRLSGYEAEMRVSFLSVWDSLDWLVDLERDKAPHSLVRWGLMANYSRVDSEVSVDLGGNVGVSTKPFIGQSEYSVNLGLFYRHSRIESSLLYKSFGDRLVAFSENSQTKDLTEVPADNLDFLFAYRLGSDTQLKFGAKNLLNEETVFVQDGGLVNIRYREGRSFSVAVNYAPTGSGE